MDVLGIFRTLGSLAIILGMLAGGLWAVRRFDIRLPGRAGGGHGRRLQLVERIGIDQRRSLLIVRRDDREHLMVLGPEGSVTIESFDSHCAQQPAVGMSDRQSSNFADLVKDDIIDWALVKRSSRAASSQRSS